MFSCGVQVHMLSCGVQMHMFSCGGQVRMFVQSKRTSTLAHRSPTTLTPFLPLLLDQARPRMRASTPPCDFLTLLRTPSQGPVQPCRQEPDWDLDPAPSLGTCSTACLRPWWKRLVLPRPRPRRTLLLYTACPPLPLGLDSTHSALVSTLTAVVSTRLTVVSILWALVRTLSSGQHTLSSGQHALSSGQ